MIESREYLMDTDPSMYLTTGEVAVVLKVGTTTVKKLESSGRLPALKNLRGWRYFNAGDVFAFMEERGNPET
ncbi:helix-turn-helix domain-containing protein [Nocardiopsis exhalans]|uniref:Excisionase family DNA binding protein n=2 Tax=Nocardiopsis TaxID=2013 RepID=A0A840W4S7_9ACTN|nr:MULTISPECIES: helix-turn-helix domain-containing protein [Nocardiopsis]MBB5491072.1 excisionase family DNA binding protein [Nocardiopsis metallicus]USY17648.1 helix-turn-helix domain-containing protein [Nocardiopsis exhalans]